MVTVHILGAGTPTPTPERFGSSFALEIGNDQIMIDCGPAATHKLVKAGLWPTNIDYLFFTHHHFDHDIDYPCFLLCRWDQSTGKENMLKVFGPNLTEKITTGILDESDGLFAHDWIARVNHPLSQKVHTNRGGSLPRKPPQVEATDIGPGLVFETSKWSVKSAPAKHVQPYLDSLAYRFDTPGGSVVFTGDTEPCDPVIELAQNADLMLCMCWDEQSNMNINGESEGQCGTTGAAEMAQKANVKKLALVHIGPNLSDPTVMNSARSEVENIFSGEIIFANELDKINL